MESYRQRQQRKLIFGATPKGKIFSRTAIDPRQRIVLSDIVHS
jgi:hypothetical protein